MTAKTRNMSWHRRMDELSKQLSTSTKQQMCATMALVGWRYEKVARAYYRVWSPVGEPFTALCGTVEDAGVHAHYIWHDRSQAMWTGRKLEDFDEA